MEVENSDKSLNFLDITIMNKKTGAYQFKIHRKQAITNVQIKKHSSHDPKIMNGIFKGFVHRATKLCSKKHLLSELEFLTNVFVENGYEKQSLHNIIKERTSRSTDNGTVKKYISLPWVPGLSQKLKKIFKKADYTPVFKSGKNLKDILTSKNKPKLPDNSHPGVYKLKCSCGKNYVGETKLKISKRIDQHHICTTEGKWERSAVAEHSKSCHGSFNWYSKENTLKVTCHNFERKVREALEIQYHLCSPKYGGLNQDDGQYVTSTFWQPMLSHLREQKKPMQ